MITADLTIMPIGTQNTQCTEYVKSAVQIIKSSGLNYELTGMGTQIEAESLTELYDVITKAQEAVFNAGTDRVYTVLKIDDRRDVKNMKLKDKVDKVEQSLN